MPSNELDPTLAAECRLFSAALEKFFLRSVLPRARRYSAVTDEITEKIEALPEEVRDEQRRVARTQELQDLETLLETVRRAASFFAIRRFSRYANALEDERIRERLARACVERLFSLIGQLFTLFDVPERADTWTAEFERWLAHELQRISDRAIIRTASSGGRTTDQEAVDQRTQQIGDRAVSRQPPDQEEVAARPQRIRSQSQSSREVDSRKALIGRIKLQGENEADRIAVLMDEAIEKMPPKVQLACAPLPEWAIRISRETGAPCILRTWKEFLDQKATHNLVRIYINKVPSLPSEISKKAK